MFVLHNVLGGKLVIGREGLRKVFLLHLLRPCLIFFVCGPLLLEIGQVQLITFGSWAVKGGHFPVPSTEK